MLMRIFSIDKLHYFLKADSDYGTRISEGLGLILRIVKKLSSMSLRK